MFHELKSNVISGNGWMHCEKNFYAEQSNQFQIFIINISYTRECIEYIIEKMKENK